MQKMIGRRRVGAIAGILTFLVSLYFISLSLAQDKPESSPCPKPYIKLIKPKLAKPGEQIIIRGHRFGKEEQGDEVIFHPDFNGKIISWRNSRITVVVPPGAKTGSVVVKTKCATSNGEFFKVVK
jgi:hypothetical protein